MILTGRNSDRTRERRWHLAGPCILAAIGFVLCTQGSSSALLAAIGMNLAVVGVVTCIPMFWALPTSFLGGAAAAAGIALVNCTGNLGGFFSPLIIGSLQNPHRHPQLRPHSHRRMHAGLRLPDPDTSPRQTRQPMKPCNAIGFIVSFEVVILSEAKNPRICL